MIKRDYILRWTQELAKVIARLIGKDPEEALELLDKSLEEQLQLDAKTLTAIPKDKLIDHLSDERGFDLAQQEFIAELLYLQCKNLDHQLPEGQDFTSYKDKLEKALTIFEHVEKEQGIFSFERKSKMAHIHLKLEELKTKNINDLR